MSHINQSCRHRFVHQVAKSLVSILCGEISSQITSIFLSLVDHGKVSDEREALHNSSHRRLCNNVSLFTSLPLVPLAGMANVFSFHLRIGIQSDVFPATCVLIPREPQWLLGSSPSAMRYWCKGLALLGSLAALLILWKMFMCLSSCFRLFFIVSRS
ncbi:hypothetical protein ACFX12_033126 [Malus domestica]